MKKIIFMLTALSVLFAACEKTPEAPKGSVSFETALPVLSEGVATLTVKITDYTGTEPVTVPVTFAGSAVKGTDYTVSAEAFVVGGNNPVTTITITQTTYDANKSINATLNVPEGFIAGTYPSCTFNLSGQVAKCSFPTGSYYLYNKVRIPVSLFNGEGNPYKLQYADEINIVVDESSTAVEGTHFKFTDNNKKVKIEANNESGIIELEMLQVSENADKIVLKLDLGSKYGVGDTDKVEITICEPISFTGKWIIKEFVSDADYMNETWWLENDATQLGKYPVFDETDGFEITGDDVFIPGFNSGFKNYFVGESQMTEDIILKLRGVGVVEELQMYNFTNVNRNFSETSKDIKDCLVGIRMLEDEETSGYILDMHIVDYIPTDFLTIFNDFYMIYPDSRPSTISYPGSDDLTTGLNINLKFQRAE